MQVLPYEHVPVIVISLVTLAEPVRLELVWPDPVGLGAVVG